MRYLFIFLAIGLLVTACDSTDNSTAENDLSYIPLEVGNKWVMQRTQLRFLPDDVLGDTVITSIEADTFVVKRDTIINNERWYEISTTGQSLNFTPWTQNGTLYTVREDGFWNRSLKTEAEILAIKQPFQVGEIYSTRPGLETTLKGSGISHETGIYGPVPTTQYDHLYKTSLKPFTSANSNPEAAFYDYPMAEEMIATTILSKELGIIQVESIFVSPDSEQQKAIVAFILKWDLVEFIAQ